MKNDVCAQLSIDYHAKYSLTMINFFLKSFTPKPTNNMLSKY